jgi:hypothetical protein
VPFFVVGVPSPLFLPMQTGLTSLVLICVNKFYIFSPIHPSR